MIWLQYYLKAEAFYSYEDASINCEYRAFHIYERLMCYDIWCTLEDLYDTSDKLLDKSSFKYLTPCRETLSYLGSFGYLERSIGIIRQWDTNGRDMKQSLIAFTRQEFKKIWPDTKPKKVVQNLQGKEMWIPSAKNIIDVTTDLPYLSWKEWSVDRKKDELVKIFLNSVNPAR